MPVDRSRVFDLAKRLRQRSDAPVEPAADVQALIARLTSRLKVASERPAHTEVQPRPSAPVKEKPLRAGSVEALADHWNRLRGSRRYPALAELDRKRIGTEWPDSVLLDCTSGAIEWRGASKALRVERLGEGSGAVAYSPTMIEWIAELAGQVARTGQAIDDTEEFPSTRGPLRYRLILLPLGEARVDHVLGSLAVL